MKQTFGYARISTPKQNIERQIRNISAEYPEARIFAEAYSGRKINRPEWDRLLKLVQSGDTIVFDSVSRMSRNADDGIKVYMDLYNKGVNLVFLKEQHISTATYRKALTQAVPMTGTAVDCILQGINQYLMALASEQIRLAFEQAEKEVQDLRQRTAEGLETAKRNGKQIGLAKGTQLHTKKGDTVKAVIAKHSIDFGGSLSDPECMALAGVARNTFYKYKRELKDNR